MKHIVSRDNPQFRRICRIGGSGRERRASGELLLDGTHLIDAYAAAFGVEGLVLIARASHSGRDGVLPRLEQAGPQALVLADALFDEACPVDTPTGLMALAPLPVVKHGVAKGALLAVMIDGVQDPGNLGAILRSAAAAGARRAYLSAQCADPWSPRCLRGGMGAQFVLELHDRADLLDAARCFDGRVIAADSRGTETLFSANLTGATAAVIGAEGQGISPELLALAHVRLRIPMAAGIESLNAATAAALLCYEWRRQNHPVQTP